MNAIRRTIAVLLLAAASLTAFAQTSKIPQRNEIVQITPDSEDTVNPDIYEVFDQPVDGQHHYFLSVGHLGFGDEVFQVLFDPVFELFIPLGDTLDEAIATMESLKALFKEKPDTTMEIEGCLAFGFPNSDKLEKVTVTYKKVLLSKKLMFSVEREGYIRATYVARSEFNSLVSGVKFHKKLHPKQ